MTLEEWLDEWFQRFKAPWLKSSSLKNIEMIIRLHLPADLKAQALEEIQAERLQDTIHAVQASRMREYTQTTLADVFGRALKLGMISVNPMNCVERYHHHQKQGKALSKAERRELMQKLEDRPLYDLYDFYLWTGCRRSEALAISWDNVDFDSDTLFIPGTKTENSARVIPIFPHLRRLLERLPHSPSGRLFEYSPDYVSRTFKSFCPLHKLHDLRHTFATRCIECGIDLKVVQKWLGHSDFYFTARTYIHVLDNFQRREALKLTEDEEEVTHASKERRSEKAGF